MSAEDDADIRCPTCQTIISRTRAIFARHCPVCGSPLPPPPGVVEVPPLGEHVSAATLTKWHIPDGGTVEADQPVCELETDNATVDLPAPHAGILTHLQAEGATVRIGDRIAEIS